VSTPIDQPPPIIAYSDGDQLSPDVSAPAQGSDPADVAAINPDDPPWGLLAAVGVLFASLALLVLIPVFTIIPYVIWRGVNLQAVGEMLQTDKTAILISILANFPAHLLTLALVWAIVTNSASVRSGARSVGVGVRASGFGRAPGSRSVCSDWDY
jgi:hypothetical protein